MNTEPVLIRHRTAPERKAHWRDSEGAPSGIYLTAARPGGSMLIVVERVSPERRSWRYDGGFMAEPPARVYGPPIPADGHEPGVVADAGRRIYYVVLEGKADREVTGEELGLEDGATESEIDAALEAAFPGNLGAISELRP